MAKSYFVPMRAQRGFTLIELIVTMVVVGILSVGLTNFINQSVEGYADSGERQQLAAVGWVVSEKVSREIRNGLPNSFRLNGDGSCLEFVPIKAGSHYLSVPTVAAASSFEVVPFPNYSAADVDSSEDRVAVYPSSVSGMYALADPGVISSLINQIVAGATPNAISIELSSNHQFATESPTDRLYVVGEPVMFCFVGDLLYRYSGYGYQSTMPGSGFTTQVVLGNRLADGVFSYSPGTLSRSGVVTVSFEVRGKTGSGTQAIQAINQEVQIRNVP